MTEISNLLSVQQMRILNLYRLQIDSGTSMAAPHVTGAAALFKAQFPDASPAEVISNIRVSWHVAPGNMPGRSRGYSTGDADGLNEPLLIRVSSSLTLK